MGRKVFPDRRLAEVEGPPAPLKRTIRAALASNVLLRAALATLVAALLALADPMGLDEAADRHSADVIGRISAMFYGGGGPLARDRIAVVEVTDQTLNRLAREEGQVWPPPRLFYARVLGSVAAGDKVGDDGQAPLSAKPAAVFFDYAFVSTADPEDEASLLLTIEDVTRYGDWKDHQRCQSSPLAKIECIIDKGGVPVIIGKNYPPNACVTGENSYLRPANLALASMAVMVPLGWPRLADEFRPVLTRESYVEELGRVGFREIDSCPDIAGVLVSPPWPTAMLEGPADASVWRPLGEWNYDLSPALAMAYALCRWDEEVRSVASGPACAKFTQTTPPSDFPEAFDLDEPVGPDWGSRPDEGTREVRDALLDKPPAKPTANDVACDKETPWRLPAVAWAQLTSGLGDGADAVAVPCPYHLTVDVDAFANPDHDIGFLREKLAGRAIAIGAAQSLSNDWIATTLSARRAGVHYHAMTLDNVLTYGAELPQEPPSVFRIKLLDKFDWGDVLELACLFLIAVLVELARRRMGEGGRPGAWSVEPSGNEAWWSARIREAERYWPTAAGQRGRMRLVAGVLLMAGLVLGLATAITVLQHWAPLNFVGLIGFTLAWVAYELWSKEGWGGVTGLLASAVLLAPVNLGRRLGLLRTPSSVEREAP